MNFNASVDKYHEFLGRFARGMNMLVVYTGQLNSTILGAHRRVNGDTESPVVGELS